MNSYAVYVVHFCPQAICETHENYISYFVFSNFSVTDHQLGFVIDDGFSDFVEANPNFTDNFILLRQS